ncbi:MAG: TIGR04283 family arsenosugar biosynthesis glycosyltransferase [Gammaproteobacteria bacterium]|nr:TIGR04283 family arsenosugar biosynthesis glycosyltransferase [Gammaproteobacteria bacterium]
MPPLSIIIPVLDEADQIPHLITHLFEASEVSTIKGGSSNDSGQTPHRKSHLSEAPENIAIAGSSSDENIQMPQLKQHLSETTEEIAVEGGASNDSDQTPHRKPHLSDVPDLIAVDGGSTDETLVLLSHSNIRVISAARGRSNQMNEGAAVATGDVLLFLHADTRLPPDYIEKLALFIRSGKPWGRFNVRFDDNHPMFRLIASMMNWRSRLTGICTGDQAIFIRRSTFESLNGFADIPLFEDIDLCKRLKSQDWPFCIKSPVTTSGRRWRTHGFCKTILLMSWLRLLYFFGVSPEILSQIYYKPDQGITDQAPHSH